MLSIKCNGLVAEPLPEKVVNPRCLHLLPRSRFYFQFEYSTIDFALVSVQDSIDGEGGLLPFKIFRPVIF